MLLLVLLSILIPTSDGQQTAAYPSNDTRPLIRVGSISSAPFLQLRSSRDGYEGFVVELLDSLAEREGFRYQLRLSADNMYGVRDERGEWTGLIGMLVRGEIDVIAADLTVSWTRMEAIDFSRPFMSSYLTVLMKVAEAEQTLSTWEIWFGVFSAEVWILILVIFLVSSLFLWIVVRISPGETAPPLSLLDSAWCLFTPWLMTNQLSPKSLATRLLACSWWLFYLCLLFLYFLSLPDHVFPVTAPPRIKSAHEALQRGVEVGVLEGGATRMLLEKSQNPLHRRIWAAVSSSPEEFLLSNYESGLLQVHNKPGKFGMVMEYSAAKYLSSMDCSLYSLDNLEDRHYALGFRKGSDLRIKLSRGLLRLTEEGRLSELKLKWWPTQHCESLEAGATCRQHHIFQLDLSILWPLFVFLAACLVAALVWAWGALLVSLAVQRKLGSLPAHLKALFMRPCGGAPAEEKPKKNPSVATQTVLWATTRSPTPTSSPTILSQRIFYEGN